MIFSEPQTNGATPDELSAEGGFDTVVVLDFGSQYSQLIARRVREAGVYSILLPWDTPWEEVSRLQPKGIILSGGPASVYDHGAPSLPA
jgi:GMP synthase (glutamine-hydrolysing)